MEMAGGRWAAKFVWSHRVEWSEKLRTEDPANFMPDGCRRNSAGGDEAPGKGEEARDGTKKA